MMCGNAFLSRRTVTIRHVISSDMVCQYYTRCGLVFSYHVGHGNPFSYFVISLSVSAK